MAFRASSDVFDIFQNYIVSRLRFAVSELRHVARYGMTFRYINCKLILTVYRKISTSPFAAIQICIILSKPHNFTMIATSLTIPSCRDHESRYERKLFV